ncbi:MAG: hypothetical protein ACOX3T_04490 [Bdellovibrionota bacterium]
MFKKLSGGIFLLFISVLVLCLDACVLVPFIDSYKQIGVSEGDRQALLPKTLKKFQDFVYWGQYSNALAFAKEDEVMNIRESLKRYKEIKIVSMKVDDILFEDDSKKATVDIVVSYYKIPQYVVAKEKVREVWEFSLSDWKIKERVMISEE